MKIIIMRYSNKLFILSTIMLFSINLKAQKFADTKFYLIDSLALEDINEHDRQLIDSILPLYHNEKKDTSKLSYIEYLADNCWDDVIWTSYNNFMLEEATRLSKLKNLDDASSKVFYTFIGNAIFNQAYYYNMIDDYENAIKYYNQAFEKYVKANNKQGQGSVLITLSTIYQDFGETVKAIETAEKAIELIKGEKTTFTKLACYYNMATIQMNMNNDSEADYYIDIILKLAKEIDDTRMYGLALYQRSLTLFNAGKFVESKDSIQVAYSIFKNSQDYNALLNIYGGKVDIEIAFGNFKEALDINKQLEEITQDLETVVGRIKYHKNFLVIYYNTKEFDLAKKHGETALKLANEIKELNTLQLLYNYLGKIEQESGNYKKANEYLILRNEVAESLNLEKAKNQGIKQALKYKYEKQKEIDDLTHKKEVAIADAQKQRNRIGFIASGIIAVLIALFSFFIFNKLKVIRKQKIKLDEAYGLLEESKKNELAVSNLKALQSQMNPHFIFNALNSVQDLVLLKDIRSSNKFLGKFSDLIRKILLSSKNQFISLEEEVEILRLYLDLEKLRFGEEFHIDFSCDISEEKQEEIQLPAMFIQPYVENAIKHGLFSKKGEKRLKVAFKMIDNHTLECIVQDNGIGQQKAAILKEQRLHLHTGFSTEAINERIRLLNQTLDKKILLNIEDLMDGEHALGTKITLLFPV